MKNNFYTYCILKYKHSPFLDESINIGVLIYFSSSQRFYFKYSKYLSRVKSAYNNVPEKTIKEYLRQIHFRLEKYQSIDENIFPLNDSNLKEFLHKNILPIDAGVIQFSNFKTNIQEFEDSFVQKIILEQYFIEDYKSSNNIPQEPKIISNLYKELKRSGFDELANKNRYQRDFKISTSTGSFNFDFAWKNGVWNLVKPVGFDLKTGDGIIQKARNNLGEFTDLESEVDKKDYICNIIVGRPSDKNLFKNYDNALNILRKLPNTKIVEEVDLKKYSQDVIDAVSRSDG